MTIYKIAKECIIIPLYVRGNWDIWLKISPILYDELMIGTEVGPQKSQRTYSKKGGDESRLCS